MKKLRLLSLALVLVALTASGMSTSPWGRTHLLCDDFPAPNSLCNLTVDTGCNNWCQTQSTGCEGFTNVHGSCNFEGDCNCRGTPLP